VEHYDSIDNKLLLPSLKLPVTSQDLINTPVKSDLSMGQDILANSPNTLTEHLMLTPSKETYYVKEVAIAKSNERTKPTTAGDLIKKLKEANAKKNAVAGSPGSDVSAKLRLFSTPFVSMNGVKKSTVFILMTDAKGRAYWCYRADMFGMLYSVFRQEVNQVCDDIDVWNEYFKKDIDIAANIEINCTNKDLLDKLTPAKHGSKILAYHISSTNTADLEEKVSNIVSTLKSIHADSRLKNVWVPLVFDTDELKVNDKFKSAVLADDKFFVLLKSNLSVEMNVSLDTYFHKDAIKEIARNVLFNGNDKHYSDWPTDVIQMCFTNGVIPAGF
jgi:hypothetical protein